MHPPTPPAPQLIGAASPQRATRPEPPPARESDIDTAFQKQGYVRFDNVFDPETLQEVMHGRPRPVGRTPAVHRFSTQPLLANIARRFLGTEALLLNTVLWEVSDRFESHGGYFNEHTVFDTAPGSIIGCAIAMTDVPAPVSFRIIQGGHAPERGFLAPDLSPVDEVHPLVETVEALQAGSMLVFNSTVPRRFGTSLLSFSSPAVICAIQFAGGGSLPPMRDGFNDAAGTFRLPDEYCVDVVERGALRPRA